MPDQIQIPASFAPFLCPDPGCPDEEYRIRLLTEPLRPDVPMLHREGEAHIYETKKGWLHIYPALGDEVGCQVACLFCPDGHHTLYYPASKWDHYSETLCCAHLICGERLLLRHDSLLLHSSLVSIHGKAVLFSGPSGAGKSTQARLWQEHLGAGILNGDRTVIQRRPDGFYGGGSIWSGTSGIYDPGQAPIAGIFLVEKAPEDRLERLGFQAFPPLFTQTIVNSWDPTFIDRAIALIGELMSQIPIYRLCCRPERSAVELVYRTLFGKEPTPCPNVPISAVP